MIKVTEGGGCVKCVGEIYEGGSDVYTAKGVGSTLVAYSNVEQTNRL